MRPVPSEAGHSAGAGAGAGGSGRWPPPVSAKASLNGLLQPSIPLRAPGPPSGSRSLRPALPARTRAQRAAPHGAAAHRVRGDRRCRFTSEPRGDTTGRSEFRLAPAGCTATGVGPSNDGPLGRTAVVRSRPPTGGQARRQGGATCPMSGQARQWAPGGGRRAEGESRGSRAGGRSRGGPPPGPYSAGWSARSSCRCRLSARPFRVREPYRGGVAPAVVRGFVRLSPDRDGYRM